MKSICCGFTALPVNTRLLLNIQGNAFSLLLLGERNLHLHTSESKFQFLLNPKSPVDRMTKQRNQRKIFQDTSISQGLTVGPPPASKCRVLKVPKHSRRSDFFPVCLSINFIYKHMDMYRKVVKIVQFPYIPYLVSLLLTSHLRSFFCPKIPSRIGHHAQSSGLLRLFLAVTVS